jgi:hypothetical protein
VRFGEVYIDWLAIRNAGQYFAIVIADDQSNDGDPRCHRLGITLCARESTAMVGLNPLGNIREERM